MGSTESSVSTRAAANLRAHGDDEWPHDASSDTSESVLPSAGLNRLPAPGGVLHCPKAIASIRE
jgi:hypothetical protein